MGGSDEQCLPQSPRAGGRSQHTDALRTAPGTGNEPAEWGWLYYCFQLGVSALQVLEALARFSKMFIPNSQNQKLPDVLRGSER